MLKIENKQCRTYIDQVDKQYITAGEAEKVKIVSNDAAKNNENIHVNNENHKQIACIPIKQLDNSHKGK